MIRRVEALNYRCLRYVSQPLDRFHVLVGPNASGKTTFLDVVSFLGRLVADGPEAAIAERTQNFADLIWRGAGKSFELAVEAEIPEERRERLKKHEYDTIRYEARIGVVSDTQEVGIAEERALLKKSAPHKVAVRSLFPVEPETPPSIVQGRQQPRSRTVLSKAQGGNDNYYSEVVGESGKGWYPSIRLGPRKSALGNLHEDEKKFPVSTWLKRTLAEGIQTLALNSLALRKASPPGLQRGFRPDGANLPWVVAELRKEPARFKQWLAHLRTALPDLKDVQTLERPDDKHRYLKLCYQGGLSVPSWMASDGTLRLLALTLTAYLPGFAGVYLIEEPENGIHPRAVEAAFRSLSSAYQAQMLLATHSPIMLSLANPSSVLCFKKCASGATDIVRGDRHPDLKDWKGQPNLSVLFAGGVLG